MITRLLLPCLFAFSALVCRAQDYSSFTKTTQLLLGADAERIFNALASASKIPLVAEDSVAFLYKGDATSVIWVGDFNDWGGDRNFKNNGKKIPGTNIWMLKAAFPADARLDYKIVVDGSNWLLDPSNTNQQWSGVGGGSPNSELRMPRWQPDPITEPIPAIFHGRLVKDILMDSKVLGYQVTYSVYLPPNYRPSGTEVFPIIYVTDGYEYLHEELGNMTTILDNLIHLQKIKPVMAVFIDQREPINRSNNRRMQELAMNETYLNFVTSELIPKVEGEYDVSSDPHDRAIIGASLGGLTAAFFAFSKPEIFGMAGIQSPAFWFRPEIFTFCESPEKPPVKIYMTVGTVHDRMEGARKMKSILEKNTCTYQYQEVHQGHSWGNWRDLIDDMLIYFFGVN